MRKILDFKNYSSEAVIIGLVAILTLIYFAVRVPAVTYLPITNCTELQAMNANLSGNYQLSNDIDCSATSGWNAGTGFLPVGSLGAPFTGTLDGNGKKINGLYINRPSVDYIGLFGSITFGVTISNLGIENANIIGHDRVGILVGDSDSSNTVISESYSSGIVNGNQYVGGLVGQSGGQIYDSYSVAGVNGYSNVGGLVGFEQSIIANSYSSGSVTGTSNVGGLVGQISTGTITNSFWDTQTSGQLISAGGTGKTTAEMKTQSTISSVNWNLISIWSIDGITNSGYPFLRPVVVPDTTPPDTAITGSPTNPSSSSSATFTFTSTEANSTFECQLDALSFVPCLTPQNYAGLSSGNHTFSVRAIDQALNTDQTVASFTWVINLNTNMDTDGDGVFDNVDQCPTVAGSVFAGCPFSDITKVTIHIAGDKNPSECGPDSKGKPINECKKPVVGAVIKVFDRENANFINAYGTKKPKKEIFSSIFTSDLGKIAQCTTDSTGTCQVGEDHAGRFIVIAKLTDGVLVVYDGKFKEFKKQIRTDHDDDEDDNDTVTKLNIKYFTITKQIHFTKVIDKNGKVKYNSADVDNSGNLLP